uniref:palmitoyl-CoA hydrolase n=1 Tax=Cyclopterus lumpus TaxID=8103 RepID=A0A8C2ZJ85_CYCLU
MKTARIVRGSPALLRLLLPLLLSGTVRIDGYRPVIIVHGIFDGPKQFKTLSLYITKTHPGTEVSVIDLYDNLASLRPLWRQVQDFSQAFDSIVRKAPEGVHLLCFSQGGLICRALLSVASHHNVHTFVSLSAPQAGQYGDTDYLKWLFPDYVKRTLFRICYSSMGQKLSFCDYWNGDNDDLKPAGWFRCGSSADEQPERQNTEQTGPRASGLLPSLLFLPSTQLYLKSVVVIMPINPQST